MFDSEPKLYSFWIIFSILLTSVFRQTSESSYAVDSILVWDFKFLSWYSILLSFVNKLALLLLYCWRTLSILLYVTIRVLRPAFPMFLDSELDLSLRIAVGFEYILDMHSFWEHWSLSSVIALFLSILP